MLKGTCIGFLPDAGCGLIYADEMVHGSHIVFVHFRDIEPQADGWQGLEHGQRVSFLACQEKGRLFYRSCAATGEKEKDFVRITGQGYDLVFKQVEELKDLKLSSNQTLVITGDIPQGWQLDTLAEYHQDDILFYQCRWQGKAIFKGYEVKGDLVFLGCSFEGSFSLKEAKVLGAVHMEGCDFSGQGGASFRGLQAQALYLDFGVKGPRDMVWLNEMYIAHNVVIGGCFESTIQILREQDNRVTTQTCKDNAKHGRPCFQRLYVGKESYKSQNINRTVLKGDLDINGLCYGEVIDIDYAEIHEIHIVCVSGGVGITCQHSKVLGNVRVDNQERSKGSFSKLDFQDTYIEGHFTVRYAHVEGLLNLDDATVERVIRLHQLEFSEHGGLQLARLCANRLVMDDFTQLYGSKKKSFLGNPRFHMLKREQARHSKQKQDDVELVQEYVLLKNLLSQEGQLKLEDEAFYNMRQLGHWHYDLGMLLFNYVFGWGVRLQNILVSVVMMILLFVIVYHQVFQFEELNALQLSIQSTFLAFFGSFKPEVVAGEGLSWLVLLQSVLGVIFVTVFVGAYVRKLLR